MPPPPFADATGLDGLVHELVRLRHLLRLAMVLAGALVGCALGAGVGYVWLYR
jgi:integral membrane sensor domain MASE1